MTDQEPTCQSCGVPFASHLGLQGTCKLLQRYRIALADAIRSPMGIQPHSAEGLVSEDEVTAAERRRVEK